MTPILKIPDRNAEFLSNSRNRYLYVLVLLVMIAAGLAAVVLLLVNLHTPQSPVLILFTSRSFSGKRVRLSDASTWIH